VAGGLLEDIDEQVQFTHHKSGIVHIDFHLHDGCEIYYLLSGDVQYFVEGSIYPLAIGELVITNPQEIHKPTFASATEYERIFIQFNPRYIAQFNTSSYDLLRCFYARQKGEHNRISLTKVESTALSLLFRRYEQLLVAPTEAAQQLKLCCLLELLVLINQQYESHKNHVIRIAVHDKLASALDYIERHIREDLSLATLERELYISRYYLSKLFKRHIGNTIHEYIIYKRIVLAKQALEQGHSVAEARELSGFADYTSFLKMFKRTVGVLPKDYPQNTSRFDTLMNLTVL